ncbi:DUF2169 domain-containing protein [Mitsuaria sp. GD03876]|uniref:DUF2169 family type VI secretion system accessory protein n=1 Tax=Mitsuaria sp. GD03876 TaxID=2975399 RepID=UPI002446C439|nr:DUF2169 domain-containing protein [Mitsuaria sp. GD03876]MDH0868125.1 DUF2169 domain-containing protein [Mitsuaria sp. GD03876]
MDEPAFYNHSGHHAQVLPILDRDGAEARIVLVKASYDIVPGVGLRPAETPREIRMGDEPWGDPDIADLRLPADYGLPKPGTDFVLSGHAVPPAGPAATRMDVGIRVRDHIKLLQVHGPRVWERRFGGVGPGESGPLERTPLAWSRAYGGSDFSDPSRPLEDARNPVGSGVCRHPETLVGRPAPQIETPGEPITSAGGRHTPAGCAPLGRHFAPRRDSAGTHDAAWMSGTYPARPADYRAEHEHCAAPGLVFDQPLRGGEPVRIAGVHPEAVLDFALPKRLLRIDAVIDGHADARRPHLDTVVVDSDALVLELVWRAVFRCPSKMRRRFTSITVQSKEYVE